MRHATAHGAPWLKTIFGAPESGPVITGPNGTMAAALTWLLLDCVAVCIYVVNSGSVVIST